MGSSWTRDRIYVASTGRKILIHCAAREVPLCRFLKSSRIHWIPLVFFLNFWPRFPALINQGFWNILGDIHSNWFRFLLSFWWGRVLGFSFCKRIYHLFCLVFLFSAKLNSLSSWNRVLGPLLGDLFASSTTLKIRSLEPDLFFELLTPEKMADFAS